MGVPNVVYKWKSLRTLYISVFVMNMTGCVIVIVMIVSAVKLRMGLGQYMDLVVPGEANFWPGIIFLVAFLCAPIYAIGVRLCLHLRFILPDSVPRLNNIMFMHCMLCFVSMIIISAVVAIGIHHMVNFHHKNSNGIIESMQEYATEVIAKVRIDTIQIKFRCCGSKSFKDWFNVRWMEKDGEISESKNHNESTYLSTDVPFSCCATEMLRPCIHHNIMKPSDVYLYQPEQRLTIATNGCHAKVLSHARFIGSMLILALVLLAAYQMLLTLLSRLLQTAHSNVLYIGPRKSHYLGWILGSMPSGETYNRLVYEGGEAPAEEMVLLQISGGSRKSSTDGDQDQEMDQEERISEGGRKILSNKALSKPLRESEASSVRPSSTTMTSHGIRNKSMPEMMERVSNSERNTVIPTPPPTPSTGIKSNSKEVREGERGKRQRVSKMGQGPKKCMEGTKQGDPDRPTKSWAQKSTTDGMDKRKCLSRGTLPKVNNGGELKGSRESLKCLSKHQFSWKGVCSIFDTGKSPGLPRQSSHDRIGPKEVERCRSSSPSCHSSSSDYKNYKVCGKDSVEEDEIRMRKFCRDLSTEYKKSPYLKQRKDFSEQCKQPELTLPRIWDADNGRAIRNDVCARFNPADAYNRFRGSLQDTMMRRGSQLHSGPPPIPIPGHRTTTVAFNCRQGQPRCHREIECGATPHFHSRPFPYQQLRHSRVSMGQNIEGSSWLPHQKPPRRPSFCTPAPAYFPPSLRPSGPPRLPTCPHGGGCQSYQPIPEANEERTLPYVTRELGAHSRYSGGHLGPQESEQPPRFSGC